MGDKTDETDTNDSEPKIKEEMEIDIKELDSKTFTKMEINPLEIKKEPSESGDTAGEIKKEPQETPKPSRKRVRPRVRRRQAKLQRLSQSQGSHTESSTSVVEDETPEPVTLETTVKIEPQTRLQGDVEYVLTVSNMPDNWSYMDIKNYIDTEIEPVDEMELVKDEKTGKGAIRLSYQSEQQCKSAMEKLQAKEIEGHKLTVEMTDKINEDHARKKAQIERKLKQLKLRRQRNIKLIQIKRKIYDDRMAYLRSKINIVENYQKMLDRFGSTAQNMLSFSALLSDSDSDFETLEFISRGYLSSSSSSSSSSEEELEDREEKLQPKSEERESDESSERESDNSEDSENELSSEEEKESSEEDINSKEETELSEYESSDEEPLKKQKHKLSKGSETTEESDIIDGKENRASLREEEKESSKEEIDSSKDEEQESSKEELSDEEEV